MANDESALNIAEERYTLRKFEHRTDGTKWLFEQIDAHYKESKVVGVTRRRFREDGSVKSTTNLKGARIPRDIADVLENVRTQTHGSN